MYCCKVFCYKTNDRIVPATTPKSASSEIKPPTAAANTTHAAAAACAATTRAGTSDDGGSEAGPTDGGGELQLVLLVCISCSCTIMAVDSAPDCCDGPTPAN